MVTKWRYLSTLSQIKSLNPCHIRSKFYNVIKGHYDIITEQLPFLTWLWKYILRYCTFSLIKGLKPWPRVVNFIIYEENFRDSITMQLVFLKYKWEKRRLLNLVSYWLHPRPESLTFMYRTSGTSLPCI